MSFRALTLGVRDALRTGLGLNYKYIGVRQNGRPVARCGELYIAVHQGNARSSQWNTLTVEYDVGVTISRKSNGQVPDDKTGEALLDEDVSGVAWIGAGMDVLAEKIVTLLHVPDGYYGGAGGYLKLANDYLLAATAGQGTGLFYVPLQFRTMAPILEVGPDWFGAEPGGGIAGYTLALTFGGAKRIQNITGQA